MASPRVVNPVVQRPASRQEQRVTRAPAVPFSLIWKPWQLQPCAMFPVLPGESLTSMMLQMQFWTDPLKAVLKNTPWTFEYFSFYSKFRDLPGWEESEDGIGADLIDMIESGESASAHIDADGNAWTSCPPGGVDFLLEQTKRIVEVYFREEGQAWDKAAVDGVPLVHAFAGRRREVMDKLTLEAALEDRKVAFPTNVGGEYMQALQDLAAQRDGEDPLNMDYEDMVRAAGGRVVVRHEDREDLHLPELLAYSRHHDYPVNTVEPSTGVPAVAFGHRMRQQMRKAYRFPEFGWVSCFVVARPKVLYKNQQGMFAAMMYDRANWFMPQQDARTSQSFLAILENDGPLKATMGTGTVGSYSVDLRSLLSDGEQFTNFAPDQAKEAFVTLPEVDGDRDYPTSTDVMAVFSDTSNGRIRANGVVDVQIKTHPVVKGVGGPQDRVVAEWS